MAVNNDIGVQAQFIKKVDSGETLSPPPPKKKTAQKIQVEKYIREVVKTA